MLIGYFTEYRGHNGTIEYSVDDGYFGSLTDIKDLISYSGSNVENMYFQYKESIDDYIKSKDANNGR